MNYRATHTLFYPSEDFEVARVYKQLFSAIGFDVLYIIVSELEFPS